MRGNGNRYLDGERDRLYGTLTKENASVHLVCVEMNTRDVKCIGLGI